MVILPRAKAETRGGNRNTICGEARRHAQYGKCGKCTTSKKKNEMEEEK